MKEESLLQSQRAEEAQSIGAWLRRGIGIKGLITREKNGIWLCRLLNHVIRA